MMADTRSELLAYARRAYILAHPQASLPKQPVRICSRALFEHLQAVLKLSFEGWSAFQQGSTSGKEVLRHICGSDRANYQRLKGG